MLLGVFLTGCFLWVYTNSAPVLFSLNDPKASYKIEKTNSGHYLIRYKIADEFRPNPSGVVNEWSVLVGSSKVDLDEFIEQPIIIEGAFRNTLGTPLCWKECYPEHGHQRNREIVVDVTRIFLD